MKHSPELKACLAQLLNRHIFFAHLLYDKLEVIEADEIPGQTQSLCTDGKRLYINREFFANLTPALRVSAIVHEILHCVMQCGTRPARYQARGCMDDLPWSFMLWNVSQDLIINAIIKDCGLPIGDSWLHTDDVKGGELTETVYRKLYKEMPEEQKKLLGGQGDKGQKMPQDGDGQGQGQGDGDGQGQGQNPQEGLGGAPGQRSHDGHFFSRPEDEQSNSEADWSRAVAGAARASRAKGQGTLPGALQDFINNIVEPKINWKSRLRISVNNKIKGRETADWRRLNRRALLRKPMIVIPRKQAFGCASVVVAVDTSGSMSHDELAIALGGTQSILRDARPEHAWILWCDAYVHDVDDFDYRHDDLTKYIAMRCKNIHGRGGTSFRPVFDYVEKHGLSPSTLIYFTDGECSFPAKPRYPTIWAITTDIVAPWGETIKLDV